jgi:hypothetical protein
MPLFALALLFVGMAALIVQILLPRDQDAIPLTLKLAPLAIVAFGLQLVALRWSAGMERVGLFGLSQVLLLTFFGMNFKRKPMRALAIGFLLNLVPMLFNGGYMPITQTAMVELHPGTNIADWQIGLVRPGSKDIVVSATDAPFWFLGDVFVVGRQFRLPTAFSLGDLLILIGFGWAVYSFSPPLGGSYGTLYRSGTHG